MISSYIVSSQCEECEYKTDLHLSNPICMSCTNVEVLSKKDNFKKRDLSMHRKTSCREKVGVIDD